VSAARAFGARIRDGDRWKMDLEKRHYEGGSSLDLIRMLTEPIEHGEVDLNEPELILKVEIIGDFAGFSLIAEEEQLDINKVRETMGLARIF
jgi:tRNA(Ser,Leu) C12 N-acetylase TAN1